ncbi:MAG: ABC transporter permease [Planctomycetes bacterium]|nr:ABC transporter permease [Planctomycetota bacterium]
MYKLFLCLRYLRRRRIAFFSVAAVCLCTAMVLIVVSVMNGFLQMVRDRSRGMLGDLIMENQSLQGFPYYQDFIDQVKHDPELGQRIYEATPLIISYGVIRFPSDQITKPAQVLGIRFDETCRVNDFGKGLFYEKYYPGTTTLKPQKEPRLGRDEKGQYVLPTYLEAARSRWEKSAPPDEIAKAWRSKAVPYAGPGAYLPLPDAYAPSGVDTTGLEPVAPAYDGPELPGAIIGTDMVAKRLPTGEYEREYYSRGSTITLTFVPFTDTGKPLESGTGMPSKVFRYADDCRTGVYDIDSMSVYVDFDLLQDVLNMKEDKYTGEQGGGVIPARTTQVQIKLNAGYDPRATRDLLQKQWDEFFMSRIHSVRTPDLLRRVEIRTWEEKQAKYIAAVEKEKYLVTTLFGVISVVAVFLVVCIFYMIVQQKTRDIGIIKSVGATALGVAQIFLAYGAAVGIVGGGIGTIIAVYFVKYINEFQHGLERLGRVFHMDLQVWNPEVYAFDRIPNQVQVWDAVIIYAVAVLMAVAGSVIAAVKAARIWPVEALRYE